MTKITTTQLVSYLITRLCSGYPFSVQPTKEGDGAIVSATIDRKARKLILKPSFSRNKREELVELVVESQDVSVNDFLSANLERDKIFYRGGVLYSEERQADLKRLQTILKRTESTEEYKKSDYNARISCLVVDKKVNDETLRKAFWDYMVRPALCALYHREEKSGSK